MYDTLSEVKIHKTSKFVVHFAAIAHSKSQGQVHSRIQVPRFGLSRITSNPTCLSLQLIYISQGRLLISPIFFQSPNIDSNYDIILISGRIDHYEKEDPTTIYEQVPSDTFSTFWQPYQQPCTAKYVTRQYCRYLQPHKTKTFALSATSREKCWNHLELALIY